MSTYIKQFIESLNLEDKSSDTIKSYKSDLEIFNAWLSSSTGDSAPGTGHQLSPTDITYPDIKAYRDYMVKTKKYKPASVNRKLATISKFCKWCVTQKILNVNPADQIKGVSKTQLSPKSLTINELRKFLRTVYKYGNKRDIAIAELLINTGILRF